MPNDTRFLIWVWECAVEASSLACVMLFDAQSLRNGRVLAASSGERVVPEERSGAVPMWCGDASVPASLTLAD